MFIYWAIFFILTCFAFYMIVLKKNVPVNTLVFYASIIILVTFAGLRYDVGMDDSNYEEFYLYVKSMPLFSFHLGDDLLIEPGYLLLNKIAVLFSSTVTGIFLLTALVAVGLNIYAYKRLSPFFALSVLLYFCHSFLYREMNQVREGVACAICINLIPLLAQKKWAPLTIGILIAALFHAVALVFFLTYITPFLKFKSSTLLIILGIVVLVGTVLPLGNITALAFSSLASSNSILSKASVYINSEYNVKLGVLTNPTTLKQLVFFVALTLGRKKLKQQVPFFDVMLMIYFISVCWLVLFNDFGIMAGRVATIFSTVEVVLVPCLLLLFTHTSRTVVFGVFVIISAALLALNLYLTKPVNTYQTRFLTDQLTKSEDCIHRTLS